MGDDYEVGYGKPPAKTKFQKGKSGNPSGRPKRRNPPKEPLDFQKGLIAELKSLITINEAGNKKTVAKWQALLKAAFAALVPGQRHDEVPAQFDGQSSLRRPLLMITSTRSKLPSPRWTYGRKSNRTPPRGQRIRAKQQTMKGIELILRMAAS